MVHGWRCGGSVVAHQPFGAEVPGFVFGISHNDSDALLDHCVIMYTISV